MKSIQVIFTVAAFILVAAVGLLAARTAEAGAAPNNRGIPGQISDLQGTVNNIQNALSSLRSAVEGLKLDISDGFKACTPTDLVPAPIPGLTGPISFCRLDVSSNLHVEVKNQGGVDAVASTTRVLFNNASVPGSPTEVLIPTDPVAGFGGSRDVRAPIPPTCSDDNGVCKFKISVDFPTDPLELSGEVFESNETNNTVDGECGSFIF